MNIWTGFKSLSDAIIDEWNQEMLECPEIHYFKNSNLSRIGMGKTTFQNLNFGFSSALKNQIIFVAIYQ